MASSMYIVVSEVCERAYIDNIDDIHQMYIIDVTKQSTEMKEALKNRKNREPSFGFSQRENEVCILYYTSEDIDSENEIVIGAEDFELIPRDSLFQKNLAGDILFYKSTYIH